MITRSQKKAMGSRTNSTSSASSASTVPPVKAAEAARKQQLAEIAKKEAAAAAAVSAAEREAVEATFEAEVAALAAEDAMSTRSRSTADWVANSNHTGAAPPAVGLEAPTTSFPDGESGHIVSTGGCR
ncbi:hypothetical protein ABMA27_000423 [Loxostege sticticalis]|uniref:Uncharacterized protein n=1 Tax=Loxostege sticticalis TaxID=481309 RepID=A0ABR3INE0_LOXSC